MKFQIQLCLKFLFNYYSYSNWYQRTSLKVYELSWSSIKFIWILSKTITTLPDLTRRNHQSSYWYLTRSVLHSVFSLCISWFESKLFSVKKKTNTLNIHLKCTSFFFIFFIKLLNNTNNNHFEFYIRENGNMGPPIPLN